MNKSRILLLFALLISSIYVDATISPSKKDNRKKPKEVKEQKLVRGAISESVFDRELVDDEPSAKDILNEHAAYYKNTATRLFNGTVLGYVTPWNNHGYDVAKIWAKKFDIISPVWLQILRKGEEKYELAGTHDIDAGWIQDVRKAGKKNLKIMPRILFDKFTETDFSKLLTYDDEQAAVGTLIVKACEKFNFNGIVLEVWPQLALRVSDKILYKLIIGLAKVLKSKNFDLILVIPPLRDDTNDLFGAKHFEALYGHVYAFSLMTYDFSSVQRPGANAPLYWMKHAVEHIVPITVPNYDLKRRKILLGFNMYGNDYTPDGGGPIIGHEYLARLKQLKKRLSLDEHDVENFFELKGPNERHFIFYPTLFSINERLKLARELGTGVALWELGQGLDYFYDLF